jgi:hypothetical protein
MVALSQCLPLHNACTEQFTAVHNKHELMFACEYEIQCNTEGSQCGSEHKEEILQKAPYIYTEILK